MPLTEKVTFKTLLQKGDRVQIPKLLLFSMRLKLGVMSSLDNLPIRGNCFERVVLLKSVNR